MKSIQIIWSVATVLVVTACTSEQALEEVFSDGEINEVKITATDFDYSDAATRTSFAITSSGAEFTWAANDTVGIFPNTGNQVEFPMTAGAGTKSAAFDGGGWGLKSGSTYYAYFPFSKYNYLLNDAKAKIPVSYTGQKQTGNGSTAHLGAYDFMAAPGTSPASGALSFKFAHLGALVQITLPAPSDGTYKSLTLLGNTPCFTRTGTIDLTSNSTSIVSTKKSNSLSLNLQNVTAETEDEDLVFYMMLAPMKFSGIKACLKDENNNTSYFNLTTKELQAGKIYAIEAINEVSDKDNEFVTFSDEAFRNYMVQHFDDNYDRKISLAEAEQVFNVALGEEYDSNMYKSLSGIEYCVNLRGFICYDQDIQSLDLSGNTELKSVYLWNCTKLSSLDLSQNTALTSLSIGFCSSLATLDLSNNKELQYLSCEETNLNSLNLSGYSSLQQIYS